MATFYDIKNIINVDNVTGSETAAAATVAAAAASPRTVFVANGGGGDNIWLYTIEATTAGSWDGDELLTAVDLGLPIESQAVLVVLYTLTTLLSVVGNVFVIIVFTIGKRSRTDLR